MKDKKRYSNAGLLVSFLRGSFAIFLLSMAANLTATLLSVLIPQMIAFTVDNIILGLPPSGYLGAFAQMLGGVDFLRAHIYIIAVTVIVAGLLAAGFTYASNQLNTIANERMMRRMRLLLFEHIQRMPLGGLKDMRTGDIIQRCTNDAQTILQFVSGQLMPLVRLLATVGFSFVFMFAMDIKLSAVSAAFLPLMLGYSLLYNKKIGSRFKECDEQEGVLSAYAQENLTGVRIVRAFGRERYEKDKFEKQNSSYTDLWVRLEKVMALYWNTSAFICALQLMFIVVLGTVFCVNGSLSPGDFTAFIFYNAMLSTPMRGLGRIMSSLAKARVSLGRINEIMGTEPEDISPAVPVSGDIVLKNVSFGYDPQTPVLQNINLTIPQGSVLGIIGGTGSGKSALARLLGGLYSPTEGQIYIGGKSYAELSPATVRAHVGLVLQEGYIYSRTVGQNIAIASGADQKEVERAAKTADLHRNIQGFEHGYDTVVGERGVTLSGGQRQRLCIARTLLRDTPVIIFDDSLSAVDAETDATIRQNISHETFGKTVVLISHRIATVMDADNIIVLEKGRIAEQGDHAALIKQNGIYSRVYKMQTELPEELKGGAE